MTSTDVLVVEDKSIIAKDIQTKLISLGYSAGEIATSGRDALNKAAKRKPDLVLMDIMLRGRLDGIETAKHIRTHFDIPVVYITAFSDDKTLQRAKTTEPYGYILKPFEQKELRTAVEMALNLFNMERRLKESEQWFATTLRSLGDAVIATDEDGKVRFMNPSAERLTGWQQETALNKSLNEIVVLPDQHDRKVGPDLLQRLMKNQQGIESLGQARLVAKDGRESMISKRSAHIRNRNGQILGMVLVLQDITEKLKMEQELLRAQKLESIGTLAGGIAHDFNNFLTAIWASISLAKTYADPRDKIYDTLASAEKAAMRAKGLTTQLLTFSKGGAPIKKIASIAQLIRESTEFALRGSNVRCQFALQEDLWPVEVDSGQINQVMNNLIINADQAMPDGGLISVEADNITLQEGQEAPLKAGPYIQISVTDQGVGISRDLLTRIFDPYFTTKETGSGLGLATAYSIIKKHNGLIQVDSKVGSGSTFTVFLPAKQTKFVDKKVDGQVPCLNKSKVLVMDDEEIIRSAAHGILTHLGCEAVTAKDGAEAIELYETAKMEDKPFDVLIMDLTIPGGMGGKEAIKKLRENDRVTKVIVSSGYCNDPIMADSEKYGFNGVVTKPFGIQELNNALIQVLKDN